MQEFPQRSYRRVYSMQDMVFYYVLSFARGVSRRETIKKYHPSFTNKSR